MGKAIHAWLVLPSNVQLKGVGVGVLGVGAIPTGKVTVKPSVPSMIGSFSSKGLNGADATKIAKGVAKGFAQAVNTTGEYYGSSSSVGIGVDSCKVSKANAKTLQVSLTSVFAAAKISGSDSLKLAKAISIGVSSILLTGVGAGAITGSPSPIPSTGITTLYMR